jgi:integrase
MGKNPEQFDGYSSSTMESRAARVDRFFRWLWAERDGYTTVASPDDADEYLKELAFEDASQEHKSNTMKALQTYFEWRHDERGGDEWEPERTFGSPNRQASSGDALSRGERRWFREAAMEYGSIPHYNAVSPDERDRWTTYLAQRFEKPKDDVTRDDWERANDWKYASLVWTSLDAALRPVEVERATVDWVDLDRGRLVIPKDDAAKTDGEGRVWTPVLTDRTVEALRRWIEQRSCYDRYEGRDELWLTKYGNPYDSGNLAHLSRELCSIADIETTDRDVSWYSIRRGTITELIDASDLSTAAEQARHSDIRSTRRYDQAPEHRRRDALEQIE